MSQGGRGNKPTGGGGPKAPAANPVQKVFRSLEPGEVGPARMNPVHEERAAAAGQIGRTLNAWRIYRKADDAKGDDKADDAKGDDKAGEDKGAEAQGGEGAEKAEVSQPDDPAEKEADQVADEVAGSLQDEKEGDKKGAGKKKEKKDKGDEQEAGGGEQADADKADEAAEKAEKDGGGEGADAKDGKGGDAKDGDAKDGGDAKPAEEKAAPISAKLEGVGRKIFLAEDPNAKPAGPPPEAVKKADEAAAKLKAKAHELKTKADILKAMKVPPVESIEASVAMTAFIGAGNSLYDQWEKFTTPEARIGLVGAAANAALGAAGVLAAAIEPIDGVESAFSKTEWAIKVGKGKWGSKPAKKEDLVPMCTTVYHEARHAEQWTNIARMLAGRGKSESDIVADINVAQKVASAATARKMKPDDPQLQVSDKLLQELQKPDNVDNLNKLEVCVEAYNAATTAQAKTTVYRSLIAPLMPWYHAFAPEADAFNIESVMAGLWLPGETK